jgi:hypothetical protein
MNILLIIALCVLSISIFGMYHVYRQANLQSDIDEDYTIDIDQSITDFLREGGRKTKKTFGFVILGTISLYKILIHRIKNNNLVQKIFDKIQF